MEFLVFLIGEVGCTTSSGRGKAQKKKKLRFYDDVEEILFGTEEGETARAGTGLPTR